MSEEIKFKTRENRLREESKRKGYILRKSRGFFESDSYDVFDAKTNRIVRFPENRYLFCLPLDVVETFIEELP